MYSEEAPVLTAQSAPTIASLLHQYENVGSRVNVRRSACHKLLSDGDSCETFQPRGSLSVTQLKCE